MPGRGCIKLIGKGMLIYVAVVVATILFSAVVDLYRLKMMKTDTNIEQRGSDASLRKQ